MDPFSKWAPAFGCQSCGVTFRKLRYDTQFHIEVMKQENGLGEFTMVSQPIRLFWVDWFVFHFFLGRLQIFIFFGRLPF